MASFKIRRLTRPVGGITVGYFDVSTTGTLTQSGCTTLSGSALLTGSTQFSSVGTQLHRLLFATTTVTAPSVAAASSASATITVANLGVDDIVFALPGSLAACIVFTGACAEAASLLNIRYYNTGSAAAGDQELTVHYLALN